MTSRYEYRTEYEVAFCDTVNGNVHYASIPPITDVAKVKEILSSANFKDVYKIKIMVIQKKFDITQKPLARYQKIIGKMSNYPGKQVSQKTIKAFFYFISDSIKTVAQLRQESENKYQKIYSFSAPDNSTDQTPALITYMCDHKTIGLKRNHFDNNNTINWGKSILCDALNPETDIVLNHSLEQIFPKNTGEMPVKLKNFLGNGR